MGNCREEDKPPSSKTNMGSGTRSLSTNDTLARRFEDIRELWAGVWDFCPVRVILHNRCLLISGNLQKGKINGI